MQRRTFLIAGLVVGAGGAALLVGAGRMVANRVGAPGDLPPQQGTVPLNGWVRVGADGMVTVVMAAVEMGQGVSTALPMLVAEELDVPLSQVRTEPAGAARRYGNRELFGATAWFHPDNEDIWLAQRVRSLGLASGAVLGLTITGGSTSVRDGYEVLRQAGAAARAMLVAAAAARWGVDPARCRTQDGAVFDGDGRRLGYGELAADAARQAVPGTAMPKPRALRTLVGTAPPRRDIPAKVTGAARYGADIRLPGMLFAAIRGCPVPGAALKPVDLAAAGAIPGVVRAIQYEGAAGCAPGIGVVAGNSWQAQLAVSSCRLEWAAPDPLIGAADSTVILAGMRQRLDGESGGFVFHERGDGAAVLQRSARVLRADYSAPWLAHATMEPMNCTAQWIERPGDAPRLRLWVPTQAPGFARATAARVAGLDPSQVDLEITELGGGFGRRLETDYLVPAIALARAVQPAPVQVQWSREEDMTHDFYRPAALCRLQASLGAGGRPTGWVTRSISDAITPQFLGRNFPLLGAGGGLLPDRTQAEGLWDQAYEIPHRQCTHVTFETPVPIGNWRSVGHSHMAFFGECFLDELAAATATDPLMYRRQLLADHPRHRAVLDLAAAKAGWGAALPAGRARGIALHESFGTIVAQVAEVSLGGGRPRVHKVVCALDCGSVVHPDIVAQQVEGSIIFALSACLYGEIRFRNGRVIQMNFPDYEMVRLRESPLIETWIVPSDAPPGGVGEPATPPLAPAVGNALFALTGKRLRSLPLRMTEA